jgi:hypothetical protein
MINQKASSATTDEAFKLIWHSKINRNSRSQRGFNGFTQIYSRQGRASLPWAALEG